MRPIFFSYIDDNTYKIVNYRYRGERTQISVNGSIAAQATSDDGIQYFSTDLLGSVASVTDNYGNQKAGYSYDAFGSLVQGDLSGSTDFGYLGKQNDTSSRLYNYGYRDYKTQLARFTTVDPIRDGTNWLVYCNGDAVNFVDLWGLVDYSYFSIEDSDDDIVKLSPLTKFFYGVGCYAGALVVSGVTIVEDVVTFGAGIADDPISAVGVGALFLTGTAFISSAFNDISAEISTNYVRSDYSKGKKVRDKEGNPIPLDQQSPGPLGKGANAGPENINDPGNIGGGIEPSGDPKMKVAVASILAGTAVIGNDMRDFCKKGGNIPQSQKTNEKGTLIIKKGK